jgi:phosphatidylinositol alpha-1,6-mannosyltransferase
MTPAAPVRILALVTDAYGAGGGIAQFNRDLLGALASSSRVAQIVVLPRNGAPSPNEVLPAGVAQLAPAGGKFAYSLRAAALLRSHGPFDVIFCGHLHAVPLAAALKRLGGAAMWLQLHGIEAWQAPGRIALWATDQADLVTAVSRHTRRLFLQWSRTAPETVKVLPNTVDERFSPGQAPPEFLARHGLQGKRVLLTVSRLAAAERYKGHDRVIESLARLRISHPDLVYVVAGDGDDRPRLERLAAAQGLAERVRFIGYIAETELPDLYRAADVFVMPSTGEGFGIVFLQAMASGIPVIGGDADGSRDPLRDGADGLLVAVGDTESLQHSIHELLQRKSSKPLADSFSRHGFNIKVHILLTNFNPR